MPQTPLHILLLGGQDGSAIGGAQGRGDEPQTHVVGMTESGNAFQMCHLPRGGREVFVAVALGGLFAFVPVGAATLNAIFQALSHFAPLHLRRLPQALELLAKRLEGRQFPIIDTATCVNVAVHIEAVAVGPIPVCAVLKMLVEREVGDGEDDRAEAVEGIMVEEVVVVLERLGNLGRGECVRAEPLGAEAIVGVRTTQNEHSNLAAVAEEVGVFVLGGIGQRAHVNLAHRQGQQEKQGEERNAPPRRQAEGDREGIHRCKMLRIGNQDAQNWKYINADCAPPQ